MKFIELMMPTGHPLVINTNHIVFFTPIHDGTKHTAIMLRTRDIERVTETAKEILAMINDDNG